MSEPFSESLAAAEADVAAPAPDAEALVQLLRALGRDWPDDPTAQDVRRTFAVCHAVRALGEIGTPPGRLGHAAEDLLERLIVDDDGRHRAHIQHSFDHHTAFGREMPYSRFDGPIPAAHLPVTVAEGRALLQPMLDRFEAAIDRDPLPAFRLAWKVLEHPVAPFDRVIVGWLQDMDARGLGAGGRYGLLRRSMAFCGLVERGRQRVSRASVDLLLPLLDDQSAMLAAAAARFLGMIHADPEEFYTHGVPVPLPDLLDRIAAVPAATRRAVAGGYLNGFADCEEPFALLRADPRLEGFDLNGWTIRVLDGSDDEPYLPSAQAFWFYIHEAFATDPVFVTRLIDAGHLWVALMCATEMQGRVDGMQPVLERLAEAKHTGIAQAAQGALTRHYITRH